MADMNALIDQIKGLTVLELNQLVKALETEFGVSAAAPMMMAAAPAAATTAAAPAAPVEEEKTEFDVILKAAGDKKIQVIKVVRQLTNLGLKEAKDLVDGAPQTVVSGVSKEAAADAKSKLEAEGAQVDIK